MRIGILTFWKTEDNYGQLLQCFAIVSFLRSLGHDAFLVRTTTGQDYNPSVKELLLSKLRTAYRLKSYPWYMLKRGISSAVYLATHGKLRRNIAQRDFDKFRRKYLNCTERVYTLEELRTAPPAADAYVVGSDQIWNTTDGIYFLSWAPDEVGKLSMAASFGARTASEEFCQLIAPWIKRFDLITVRERSGLQICAEAGRDDARLVPDPTLLLRSTDYLRITSETSHTEDRYMFVYFLGTRTDIKWKEIHRFAKTKGLRIVYVGSQGQEDKYHKTEATIEQWLGYMAGADYVVTNSFHGTVFALQFRKKFLTYPVSGGAAAMNGRLTTLLEPLKLQDRIYTGEFGRIEGEIDYDRVFKTLDENTSSAKELFVRTFEKFER